MATKKSSRTKVVKNSASVEDDSDATLTGEKLANDLLDVTIDLEHIAALMNVLSEQMEGEHMSLTSMARNQCERIMTRLDTIGDQVKNMEVAHG